MSLQNGLFYAFLTRRPQNTQFQAIFVRKLDNTVTFQYFLKSQRDFVPLYHVVIWCKFQLIWTKIEGADTFGVKYCKTSNLSVFL